MKLSVFGLGKLGTPLAAVLASKGHEVIGVDLNEEYVHSINAGKSPVEEPGLAELIQKSGDRLSATTSGEEAGIKTDVSFLIVPTPSDETGGFSLDFIVPAAVTLGQSIAKKDSYHLVVITSTVLPGQSESQILPALEKASGKKVGVDFGLCYSPEFVALGNVVQDMLAPDIVLIGESDPQAGDLLRDIYASVNENEPSVQRMNIVNAEITKLAVNTYVTTKISFANMISQICEQMSGANADIVTRAVGSDSRIGNKYIKPGVAYGGPCFPRDNKALSYLARSIGTTATLAEATDAANYEQIIRLGNLVNSNLVPGGKVGILGMSYKPGTNVIDESAGLHLARLLTGQGVKVTVYDPMALSNTRDVLGDDVAYTDSIVDCFSSSDLLVITTPWDEFKNLPVEDINSSKKNHVIIDGWDIVENVSALKNIKYLPLGRGDNLTR